MTGSYYVSGKEASEGKTSCIKSELNLFLSSDHKENHRILRIMDKKYPLLVSAMLFGQRALDLSSKERLIWHLKKILGNK